MINIQFENKIINEMILNTKESDKLIDNTLKTINNRISSEKVKIELLENEIKVNENDDFEKVLNKIILKLEEFEDEKEKDDFRIKISKILGGTYNINRIMSILK